MASLRLGAAIKWENELYWVVEAQHVHMGRGGATVKTRLKHIKSGNVREVSLRESDAMEEIRVERRAAHFSYTTSGFYHFLDLATYEEIIFDRETIKESIAYLKEGMEVTILNAEGIHIGIQLPNFVELKIVETDPGLRGDTAAGGSKPAKLETGRIIQVPLFIQVGDTVRIDTRTDRYIERVK